MNRPLYYVEFKVSACPIIGNYQTVQHLVQDLMHTLQVIRDLPIHCLFRFVFHKAVFDNQSICQPGVCMCGPNCTCGADGTCSMCGQMSHNKSSHGMKAISGTMTSSQDPGIGHEGHQLAVLLPPRDNEYSGMVTYSASENIQLVVLHGSLAAGEDKGQPIWTPDGETKFALTLVDPQNKAGSWMFTGNALALHTQNTTPFTVSVSD